MKKWSKLICLILALVMILALAGCGGDKVGTANNQTEPAEPVKTPEVDSNAETPADVITWKCAHTVTDGTPLHAAAVLWAEKIKEATNGGLIIEIYPNSQLGGNREILEGMQFGTIDCSVSNSGNLEGYAPYAKACGLPYLVDDTSSLDGPAAVYLSDATKPLVDQLYEAGYIFYPWTQGYRNMTSNKAVRTPEDLKGQKIRTMESELHMAHINALGGNAVPMAFSEVFTALQQGAIDGQENPYANIYTMGYHEVQKYITETEHLFDIAPLVISVASYNALPDEYKKAVDECSAEDMTRTAWQMVLDGNEEFKQKIVETNTVEIIELSYDERHAFREAVQSVYDTYGPQLGQDFVDGLVKAASGKQ